MTQQLIVGPLECTTTIPTGVPAKRKGGDHRRKVSRRALPPATVRVSPGCIEVVVPDVLGKNEAMRRAGKIMHTSSATKKYRESVRSGLIAKRFEAKTDADYVALQAMQGAWRLEVLGVWPNENHMMGIAACPRGDVDAPISQALDALMHAGILDDDARVREAVAWNMYRKGERWTVIRLTRIDEEWRVDARCAHMVAMLPPPTPVPEPKPGKRSRRAKVST